MSAAARLMANVANHWQKVGHCLTRSWWEWHRQADTPALSAPYCGVARNQWLLGDWNLTSLRPQHSKTKLTCLVQLFSAKFVPFVTKQYKTPDISSRHGVYQFTSAQDWADCCWSEDIWSLGISEASLLAPVSAIPTRSRPCIASGLSWTPVFREMSCKSGAPHLPKHPKNLIPSAGIKIMQYYSVYIYIWLYWVLSNAAKQQVPTKTSQHYNIQSLPLIILAMVCNNLLQCPLIKYSPNFILASRFVSE